MTLSKADHKLEEARFIFDDAGEVVDVQITVNYSVVDDATGEVESRVRKTVSVLGKLAPAVSRASANTFGRRLKQLAGRV